MAWRHLVEQLAEGEIWESKYECLLCEQKLGGDGPAAVHVREKHGKELEAAKSGWRPDQDGRAPSSDDVDDVDQDDAGEIAPDELDERPTGRDRVDDGGDLEKLEQRSATRDVDVETRRPTEWNLPGGNDRPQPRRDPPSSSDGDVDDVDQDEDREGGFRTDRPDAREEDADDEQLEDDVGEQQPPPMTPDEAAPLVTSCVRVVSNRFEARGVEPITQGEEDQLVQAWSPVVAKYLPHYGPEISAGAVTLLVLGPRFLEARDKAQRGELETGGDDEPDVDPSDPIDGDERSSTGEPLGHADEDFLAKI